MSLRRRRVASSTSSITFVGGIAASNTDGNDVTLTLSGLGLVENDLVLIFGGYGRNASDAGVSSAGWTEPVNWADRNTVSLSYKKMSSSPDTSATCKGSGDSDDATAYVALAFRGVDGTTPLDATSVQATGTGDNPDPGAITTVTSGAMLLVAAATRSADSAVTAPSGFAALTNLVHIAANSDARSMTCGMTYALAGSVGSNNPGAFSGWTGEGGQNWMALTIALRPA